MTGIKGLSTGRVVTSSSSPSYGGKFSRAKSAATDGIPNNRRVYVGNLKFEVSWQDLKDHMRAAGEVVRADILTDANGRSKGCGLVEFASAKDARTAITTLNDTDLQGRLIFVREDRESASGAGAGVGAPATAARDVPLHAPQLGVSKRVYVGNLSWDVEWQDLKDHMRRAGDVTHADVLKEASGRSKGCGIVEYSNIRDANNAILTLNDTELKGRLIFVREDREAVPAVPTNPHMPGMHAVSNRLYVGNLDYKTRWFELKDHFRNAGNVLRADVAMEEDGVRSRGYGIVEFATAEEAAYAAQHLNNTELNGRPIFVREDREEKRRM